MKTRMQTLMEERSITIEEIAAATQLSYKTVWSAKKGNSITRANKAAIAGYFGLTVADVFPAKTDNESNHQSESTGGAA